MLKKQQNNSFYFLNKTLTFFVTYSIQIICTLVLVFYSLIIIKMKKVYLFISACAITLSGLAQTEVNQILEAPTKTMVNKSFSHKDFDRTSLNNNKAIQSYWVSYVDHYVNLYGSSPYGLIGNLLFPDSTIMAEYSSGFASVWVHRAGQVFDLNAPVITLDNVTIDPTKKFTIDSISAIGIYTRVDNNVVDTLRFRIVAPTANQMNGVSYFGPSSTVSGNLNPNDTVFMLGMDWNYATLSTPDVVAEYKLPLDANFHADTNVNGIHFPAIATNFDTIFPSTGTFANKFGIIVDFLPGYSWVANSDTLRYNKNAWWFGSYELNGQNSYPTYAKDDYNHAAILPQDVMYNVAGGWNDRYIPSFAYMGTSPSYAYEAMAFQVKVSQDDAVGIEENDNEVHFSVYPNPSKGEFNISLASEKAETSNLVITDIVGNIVMTESIRIAGNTTKTISLANYSSGVYFLTIGNKTTKLILE